MSGAISGNAFDYGAGSQQRYFSPLAAAPTQGLGQPSGLPDGMSLQGWTDWVGKAVQIAAPIVLSLLQNQPQLAQGGQGGLAPQSASFSPMAAAPGMPEGMTLQGWTDWVGKAIKVAAPIIIGMLQNQPQLLQQGQGQAGFATQSTSFSPMAAAPGMPDGMSLQGWTDWVGKAIKVAAPIIIGMLQNQPQLLQQGQGQGGFATQSTGFSPMSASMGQGGMGQGGMSQGGGMALQGWTDWLGKAVQIAAPIVLSLLQSQPQLMQQGAGAQQSGFNSQATFH